MIEKREGETTSADDMCNSSRLTFGLSDWLNNAGALAIITSGLYLLGWTYWKAFLETFGISVEFVDTDFGKLLPRALSGLALILWSIYTSTAPSLDPAIDKGSLSEWRPTARVLILLIAIILYQLVRESTLATIAVVALLLASSIPKKWSPKLYDVATYPVPVGLAFTKRSFIIFAGVLTFLYLIVVQEKNGRRDAERKLGSTRSRIDVTTSGGAGSYSNQVLVCHASGKYFIFSPNDSNRPPRVIALDDAVVQEARFYYTK